jgi:TRAP-type C4-dicarboxylate transport system permease small subunit
VHLRNSLAGATFHRLDQAAAFIIIIAMAAMVAVVSTQVLLRYVFNESLDWAEDIARLLFVWAIFLAIPLGIRRGTHVTIELLTTHLPAGLRRALLRCMALACAALMGVVCWISVQLVIQQWEELLTTVDISVGLFMVPLALGGAHSMLHFLAVAIEGHFVAPADGGSGE